jgi:hypothetical protein
MCIVACAGGLRQKVVCESIQPDFTALSETGLGQPVGHNEKARRLRCVYPCGLRWLRATLSSHLEVVMRKSWVFLNYTVFIAPAPSPTPST